MAQCGRPGSWRRAGRYALAHNLSHLADDHRGARELVSAFGIDPSTVDSNIRHAHRADAPRGGRKARAAGVLVSALGPQLVRLVTHLDVDDDGIERAVEVLVPLVR